MAQGELKFTISFSTEELEILDAAFEVMIDSGVYTVLQFPEIKSKHKVLYEKFHRALKLQNDFMDKQG
jgi:hypothetical protein